MAQTVITELLRYDPESLIHRVDILHVLRGPPTLGDGGGTGPYAVIHVFLGDNICPHGGLATENAGSLIGCQRGCDVPQRVDQVMLRRWLVQLKLVAG